MDDPVVEEADARVRVALERFDLGESGDICWADWRLDPVESEVLCLVAPTANRGYSAVVEATVAASRLDVDADDDGTLRSSLDYLEDVARRCGGGQEQDAFDRLNEAVGR